MTGPPLVPDGNHLLLRQGIDLLERLSDPQYAAPVRGWAPVGAQYRHVLDHYRAFLQGLPGGRVDYDARARDEWIERSRPAALNATLECGAGIATLAGQADRQVLVQTDSGAGPEHPDWRPSSAGRELQFLCSHTVHHFALIKLLLEGSGVELSAEFGTAPSSLSYQRAAVR